MSLKQNAIALTLSLSILATGCTEDLQKDKDAIAELPYQFIEALAKDDTDTIKNVTNKFNYEKETSFDRKRMGDKYEMVKLAISRAKIIDMGEPAINDNKTAAKTEITLAYIDFESFTASMPTHYVSQNELIDSIDSYQDLKKEVFNVVTVYDESSDTWRISEKSANRIYAMLTDEMKLIPDPVTYTPTEARGILEGFLQDLSTGNFTNLPAEIKWDDCRHYDNVVTRGNGPQTDKALKEFISAYFTYVKTHNPDITMDKPYRFKLTGSAPSSRQLAQCFTTDEYLTGFYMNTIRYVHLNMSLDDMWDDQSAAIYQMLAAEIPKCDPEEYTLDATVNGNYDRELHDYPLTIKSPLINEPPSGHFEAEHGVTWDQFERCYKEALSRLLANGEMTEEMYNSILETLTPENYGYVAPDPDNPGGFPNQAVGTEEQVPEWCDDGSIIYGYSKTDSNGYWMMYSKFPDILETAQYYIDDHGVHINNVIKTPFPVGTTLLVDWWINGQQVVNGQEIIIAEDGKTEIEVFLPTDYFPCDSKYEMRLWKDDHRRVYSYVTLSK